MKAAKHVQILDSDENYRLLKTFLESGHFEVSRLNGESVQALDCTECPDIILLNSWDYATTLDHLRAIRSKPDLFSIPVLVYSSYRERTNLVRLLKEGANEYCLTPLLKDELILKIDNLTRSLSRIRSVSRFVPEIYFKLMSKAGIESVSLGDFSIVTLAVLVSDIRSFAEISENLSPEEIFRFLNSLFSRMEPVIKSNRGVIDKYIGDSILALFTRSSEDCLKAALDMVATLKVYNQHRASSSYKSIGMGIGIHTGEVAVGTVGSLERMNATVIGDAVNLATRVESLTKVFGVDVVLTDAIYQQLKNPAEYRLRQIDTVRVKGKQAPIVLYEAFDTNPPEVIEKKSRMMADYERALTLFKNGDFKQSMDLFTRCKDFCPEDRIPELYIRRCNSLIRVPPGKDWSGISTL